MKNILYKILPVCFLAVSLAGCEDETKYLPLQEPVPLTMNVNGKTFVMGERFQVEIQVNTNEDGEDVVANEDFDIYFTAKSGSDDVSSVFAPFTKVVVFPKGKSQIVVDFPVAEEGLDGSVNVDFVAFARGYRIANSSQSIKVSDYYRVSMSVEESADNILTEGDEFTLVATMDKVRSVPVEVTVSVSDEYKKFFETLPSTITIKSGELTAKAKGKLSSDGEMTGDLTAKLSFETNSKINPMLTPELELTVVDLESLADPATYDETKVYVNPALMFASKKNLSGFEGWWSGDKTVIEIQKASDAKTLNVPHPTESLATEGWKFWNAIEFHYANLSVNGGIKPGVNNQPWPFSATTVKPMEKYQAIKNAECVKITEEGVLKMWAKYAPGTATSSDGSAMRDYVSFGLQTFKGVVTYAPGFARFRKGMRLELRARINGVRTGFVPMISLRDVSGGEYLTNQNRIDILKNEQGNMVTQRIVSTTEDAANMISMPKLGQWNIYWVEWVDDKTINIGINGVTTVTATKDEGWSLIPTNATQDFALIMYFAPSQEREENALPEGWDSTLRAISDPATNSNTPRMEVDWIRMYRNDNLEDSSLDFQHGNLFY